MQTQTDWDRYCLVTFVLQRNVDKMSFETKFIVTFLHRRFNGRCFERSMV